MFSNFKRRVAVVSALAVLAAVAPVLSSSSVTAAPSTTVGGALPGDDHTYMACPANAGIPSAGFTDTTSANVDCIAYYGITTGVTATTYEPDGTIPRWQMALYLTRMASKAGHTLGSGADQGFTDISGQSAATQTAINQIKQLGVTVGKTATTFAPDDNVTREEMALFVNRLLALTTPGVGGNSDDAVSTKIVGNAGDSYNYTDIDAGVTYDGHQAIVSLYNLGVPGHDRTVKTFAPAGNITRSEMADWIVNALDHTNVRPAGVVIQLSKTSGYGNASPSVHISYRDANHVPVSGQIIDAFSWQNGAAPANGSPWDAAGNCTAFTAGLGDSLTKCQMDVGDASTNALGNLATITTSSSIAAATPTSFYAWTAAAGTKYDNDTHAADVSTVSGTTSSFAGVLLTSCDTPAKAISADTAVGGVTHKDMTNVKHGTTVNVTFQMSAAADAGVYAPISQAGNTFTVVDTTYQPNSGVISNVTSTVLTTDANGAATYAITQADPNVDGVSVNDNNDDVVRTLLVVDTAAADATTGGQTETSANAVNAAKPCSFETAGTDPLAFHFQDDVSTTSSAVSDAVSQNVTSYKAAASALAPVSRTATATLRDKFGSPVANAAGSAVFYGPGTLDALAAEADLSSDDDLDTAADITAVFPVNTAVCLVTTNNAATAIVGVVPGTVYYVKALAGSGGAEEHVQLAATAGGTLIQLTGASATSDNLIAAHPLMGCGARTIGPAGTASIAWNDTTTTSGIDAIAVMTTVGPSGAAEAGTVAHRYTAPGTTALGGDITATESSWTEVNADDSCDANNELCGLILASDTTANTLLVEIKYDSAAGGGVTMASKIVQYSYDSNDYFFSGEGASRVTQTEAAFEGTYSATCTDQSINCHKAQGTPGIWANGDLTQVGYSPYPSLISTFMLGD